MQSLESTFLPTLFKNVCISDEILQVCVELNGLSIWYWGIACKVAETNCS